MKASRKSSGQSCSRRPAPRQAIPDIDVQELKDKLHNYVQTVGIKEAFNLYAYHNLDLSKAVCGQSLLKKQQLLWALLKVSPLAAIKLAQLREACQHVLNAYGNEVFSSFKNIAPSCLTGKVADQLFVMLNHLRRVTGCEVRWKETFGAWLQDVDLEQLTHMREFMVSNGFSIKEAPSTSSMQSTMQIQTTPRRAVKRHSSDVSAVSVDSDGFPKVPAGISKVLSSPEVDLLDDMFSGSPPPLKKKPDAAPGMVGSKLFKKPASTKVLGDFSIVKTTMRISGGKYQSYIQHIPQGSAKKQLVVAISDKMVDGKSKGHRDVAEALLEWAKSKAAPTKGQVLKQREVLLSSI